MLPTAEPQPDNVPWDDIDVLVRGAPLLKFGRSGGAHFREFQLSADLKSLAYSSTKRSDGLSRVELRGCALALAELLGEGA